MLPNGIGWLDGRRFGRKTSVKSAKLWSNVHRKYTQPSLVRSNQNGYSCNGWWRIQYFPSREWINFSAKLSFLAYFLERWTPPPPIVETLSTMKVKKVVLGIQNLVTSARKKCEISQRMSVESVNAVIGKGEFSTTDHTRTVREELGEVQKARRDDKKTKL